MNVGFLGLGKLGLPVALSIEDNGHKVAGFDISQSVLDMIESRKLSYMEIGAQPLLEKTNLEIMDVPDLYDVKRYKIRAYVVLHDKNVFLFNKNTCIFVQ